ncbi:MULTISPECIES: threonine ammonia-lyase [Halolamina]|uniref:Threonine dehydratase n=1 Tax=Halolamina pelagica TaxID=699431 RepID=A0A1I5WDH4_9EURY|nr:MULTISPECIES: threonine/serine dehydratase [Halolamina]NHX37951.1 threonine/serine dehydratase [Halolamina sp. R1-12]SFQ17711.1 threonine dehydratase [Halolamina pelagica]
MSQFDPADSPDSTTIFPYHDLTPPEPADVYAARPIVNRHLPETPLVRSELLSAETGAEVYLKREDTLPTGAFKVRGGITLGHRLPEEFREAGLIAASTGNHGQSVAYAGRTFDVPVTIAVPGDPNPEKVATMEQYGAEVVPHGEDYDDAREWAERKAAEDGLRYVHSANEPDLVAGVGTAGLEVLDELPEVDRVVCPVGGGSGAAGYCLTVGAVGDAEVVGVQSDAADATYQAYHEGHLYPQDSVATEAEGIASRAPFALTVELMRERLDDLVRVTEEAIWEGVSDMLAEERLVVEGASASAVAALCRMDVAGETVVVPVTGRNLSSAKLRRAVGED